MQSGHSEQYLRFFPEMAQVRELPGYRPENPVSALNYKMLVGWYDFSVLHGEEKCCRQKDNGNLCHEGHRHGFVALLADDSISIIGNECAKEKFGAQDQIRIDISRLENERKRRERKAALEVALQNEVVQRERCTAATKKLREVRAQIDQFENSVGKKTFAALRSMAKNGNSTIRVKAKYVREYVEAGQNKSEVTFATHNVGTLKGVNLLLPDVVHSSASKLARFDNIYASARSLGSDAKANALSKISSALSELDMAAQDAQQLGEVAEQFFKSDLTLLCHLTDDKEEKWKAMRFALEAKGDAISKDRVKTLVTEQNSQLKKSLGATSVSATT
jgi:hypothetical protein